jgi:D-3-phosphoglycerate dehydrogenase
MKVAVLDDYQDVVRTLDAFALLEGHDVTVFTRPVPPAELAGFDALVPIRERTWITDDFLASLPALRVISQTGSAGRHVDRAACEARGIAVLEGGGSPVSTAELTWALLLAAARRLPEYMATLRAGLWQGDRPFLGDALDGRTLGIYGYGRIGSLVARYGRAFGMRVLVWGREGSRERAQADGHDVAASAEQLFADADVLSLHLRLTDATTGIVTRADLARMKPDALLVNTSRAELVERGALVEALREGRPGGAAVDVFDEEPAVDDPLLALPNVWATPHLGYVERASYELYFGEAFRNLVEWERTEGGK